MLEFWKAERTLYAPFFRVAIGLILLFDLVSTFPAIEFLFDSELNSFLPLKGKMGFVAQYPYLLLSAYAVVLILFIGGIGKHFTTFLVFIFHLILVQLSLPFITWGDKILKFTLLYFIFVNSFHYWSWKPNKIPKGFISKLAVLSIILHLFMIYLNNAFYKTMDLDWQKGYAVFYSFAQYSNFKNSVFYPLISQEFFSKGLSYFTILLQISFVPLAIWKRTRYYILFLSALVHIVMIVQFGLWKFELIVLLHYGFVLTDRDWKQILPERYHPKFLKT